MGYIIFFILLSGCVTNPRLRDNYWDKRVRENPHQEDLIRSEQAAYQKEWTYRQLHNSKPVIDVNSTYRIKPYQKEFFGMGGDDSLFWVGREKVNYLHEITITIICQDHEVTPLRSRYSRKPVSWKLSEKNRGMTTTNANGAVQINAETEESKMFENLKIIIKDRVYNVPLRESMTLEVEPEICK